MGVREDIAAYRARRELRLDAGEKKHGNTRLPYALCKKAGIDTKGMTPREAWEALEGQTGTSAESAYADLQKRWSEKTGTLKSIPSVEEQEKGVGPEAGEKIRAELNDLPVGTELKMGKNKTLIKRDNDTWYRAAEDASPGDPFDQKTTDDLILDLVYSRKPSTFTKPTRREKEKNTKAVREKRKEILLNKVWPKINPDDIIETVGGSGYTDFAVKTGDRKTIYRVADGQNGVPRVRRKAATIPMSETWKANEVKGWSRY